jgi:hypothetical protein
MLRISSVSSTLTWCWVARLSCAKNTTSTRVLISDTRFVSNLITLDSKCGCRKKKQNRLTGRCVFVPLLNVTGQTKWWNWYTELSLQLCYAFLLSGRLKRMWRGELYETGFRSKGFENMDLKIAPHKTRVPCGQRDISPRPYSRFSSQEPLLFLPRCSSVVLTRLSGPRSRPTTSEKFW